MGQFHFIAPSHDQVPVESLASAYLAGMEGIPWRSVNRWNHPAGTSPVAFSLERTITESGNLNIPWRVEGFGEREDLRGWDIGREQKEIALVKL